MKNEKPRYLHVMKRWIIYTYLHNADINKCKKLFLLNM